jgi:RimJ/RimL family protein N-acetyltransferase
MSWARDDVEGIRRARARLSADEDAAISRYTSEFDRTLAAMEAELAVATAALATERATSREALHRALVEAATAGRAWLDHLRVQVRLGEMDAHDGVAVAVQAYERAIDDIGHVVAHVVGEHAELESSRRRAVGAMDALRTATAGFGKALLDTDRWIASGAGAHSPDADTSGAGAHPPDADTSGAANLLDGTCVGIRPIEPSDAADLVAFHDSLSRESTRMRFFTVHPHLSEREVERFTTVDHHDRQALVAVAEGRIVGVGRYDRCGPDEAEVAFVVADDWHGRGVATVLLDRLARQARQEGISRFVADTLADNQAMRDVFSHWGRIVRTSIASGVVHLELALD